MGSNENRKFWAFCILMLVIAWLAYMSKGDVTFVMVDGKPVSVQAGSILRDAMVGLIAVLGTAAQALFRTSENSQQMNDLLRHTVEKLGNSVPVKDPTDPTNSNTKDVPNDIKEAAARVADAATAEAEAISNSNTDDIATGGSGTPIPPPPARG